MEKIKIITIGREYASGGRSVGKLISEKLGIPFYNKEILHMAAEKLNMSADDVKNADETAANSLLYSISLMNNLSSASSLPLNDRIYIEEREVIKSLAEQGPCVIVGRCADSILKEIRDDVLNVFIYADSEARAKRAINEYNESPDSVYASLRKHDKKRSTYYNLNTGQKWGAKDNYDLCLNSSKLGIEMCADLIIHTAANM
ncbi:MAG: cytidylate kinase-like family protein [Oscillospiraceae bacterium]|nr:cytidylate kinase-like family protein [Oscillospiraceae bacterium]MBQ5988087.1 cytidylate kinase-like family protein [Oscillospiraceae bacterium]MBR3022906.1 cytidylate kinase-like family protein [Oscillospiraceae bacterium]MBR3534296.1 cytidylate kinase-like family protein [Oscillospiraceae bacterium]